ncbi:hypothetical protein [Priestia taiwanensis]|uniref:Uncharacterized protein n=1 Tax=Priestia taiwanensis TaxID=1347902 RepID=A0A917EMP2_9BACI|nr:hypothetical protein [Priestia taiwanensis]MBM7362613.1 hypothetical protein [Priestia taiwanensis]GGE63672.1 hypothetical protein GCM10007140_12380 [Priestia taiwanensis]
MLTIQVLVAIVLLVIGRIAFYSFVRKDPWYVLVIRYGGFIGIVVLVHNYMGVMWAWIWIFGFPLLGLAFHFIYTKKKGFNSLKACDKYDEYRGWKK